jgi:hypothetical protein
MGKKYKRLIEQIADLDNLRLAYYKTSKAKRMTYGYLEFKEYAELNILKIRDEILSGEWEQGEFNYFTVYEPKPRLISALSFKDRVAQHAICNVIAPIFEKTFLPGTFACRKNKGTHAGVNHIQSLLRSTQSKYFLKTDYSKFFPSVNREILYKQIEKKITCKKTIALIEKMLPRHEIGIPIGSLISQLFANVYGCMIDRFIQFELGTKHWARYMDDIVILSNNQYELRGWFEEIRLFSLDEMHMKISKWQVSPVSHGINFLGYRIWPRHKLLRKASVIQAKRKIVKYLKANNQLALTKFIASWKGHAKHADTINLFNHLELKHGTKFN